MYHMKTGSEVWVLTLDLQSTKHNIRHEYGRKVEGRIGNWILMADDAGLLQLHLFLRKSIEVFAYLWFLFYRLLFLLLLLTQQLQSLLLLLFSHLSLNALTSVVALKHTHNLSLSFLIRVLSQFLHLFYRIRQGLRPIFKEKIHGP